MLYCSLQITNGSDMHLIVNILGASENRNFIFPDKSGNNLGTIKLIIN